jgi:hypothetical protein
VRRLGDTSGKLGFDASELQGLGIPMSTKHGTQLVALVAYAHPNENFILVALRNPLKAEGYQGRSPWLIVSLRVRFEEKISTAAAAPCSCENLCG